MGSEATGSCARMTGGATNGERTGAKKKKKAAPLSSRLKKLKGVGATGVCGVALIMQMHTRVEVCIVTNALEGEFFKNINSNDDTILILSLVAIIMALTLTIF